MTVSKTAKTQDPTPVVPADVAPDAALANIEVIREPDPSPLADRFPLHVLPGAKSKQANGLVLESF